MRDHLLDLVQHTYDLGCIDLIKITGTDQDTVIDGIAEDRSVVLQAKFANPVPEFIGMFGMPNLSKLKILLGLTEYRENAVISVKQQNRNGQDAPAGLNFVNAAGDFTNDYRFMVPEVVAEKLRTVKFKGATWHVEFEPLVNNIQRLKMQAQANAEENLFQVRTDGTDLKFSFGDPSTHAGEFVFCSDITGVLRRSWSWPAKTVISILDLSGDKTFKISDEGVAEITVNSGQAVYHYILPAQTK